MSLLCSMAVSKDCRKSDTKGSTTFLVVLYFSWMIFSRPHFFTVPEEQAKTSKSTTTTSPAEEYFVGIHHR